MFTSRYFALFVSTGSHVSSKITLSNGMKIKRVCIIVKYSDEYNINTSQMAEFALEMNYPSETDNSSRVAKTNYGAKFV